MFGLSISVLLILAAFPSTEAATVTVKTTPARSSEAYATLVYGEEFVLAARVLGQSLRESGTTRDMVALTTGSLRASSELTLAADGWRVVHVAPVHNPGTGPQPTGFPPRFAYVYTKLYIFKMTEYKKIVFLDADALVIRNMDVIFKCPGFCAALRHSERFNTGVMSLVPSTELYDDIMAKMKNMPSYTGGDQGFLNSYFPSFAHAPLFDPDTPYTPDQYKATAGTDFESALQLELQHQQRGQQYMRLPTTFNADIGLYVVASNRWMLPRSSLYVIHFTLGPFKPWVWWSGWLVRENPAWQAYRTRLPVDSRGLTQGLTPRQLFAERWMVLLPWAVLGAAIYLQWSVLGPALAQAVSTLPSVSHLMRSRRQTSPAGGSAAVASWGPASLGSGGSDAVLRMAGSASSGSTFGGGEMFPKYFMSGSLAAGYGCVVLVVITTILIVPSEVDPVYGWILSYEWGFMLLGLTYGSFLRTCYRWGRRAGHHAALQVPKLHSPPPLPLLETAASAAFLVASLLIAPWLGRMLGITSFAGTIVATVFIGLGVIVVSTVQFVFLPTQWYVSGRIAGSGPRVA
ncbi:hypothetical protein Vretifemale_19012 [Volvox reticuliferus]|uniref:Hexosyltransferase n=1 Tax=Volvox reticuliferus TaxID=1737510 RepID=A0A8J4FUZ5_9CHLO|nr:hypothetical protein Vretifemale_19012 [Volvox reticuliferus]